MRHDFNERPYFDSDPGFDDEPDPPAPLDKSTMRKHSLSLPPPVRDDALLPRHGCMACVIQPNGVECAYRAKYRCQRRTREWGLEEGFCVIEKAARDLEAATWRPLAEFLPEEDQDRYLHLVEKWLDATTYWSRSVSWSGIVWASTGGDVAALAPGSPIMNSIRFVSAGSVRRLRIGREIFPLRAKAEKAKRLSERDVKRQVEKQARAEAG